ncbi:CopD family protein [Curvibacter sp. CHRR-16]|uniref:CopD family protein n=1 Tax=Curvibacter sp. CHRR-16 TaxID=2835872 RepID=UPI001BD94CEB|nr:CopD family protein [Curvibacter sp. CHRR-16]MBT0571898.1 CopD family protein [Curvibacter sp. CHRR-16]
MLWLKTFHIVFVLGWFSAIFYFPRILVNLAMVVPSSHVEYERLLLMASKLYRFGLPLGLLATMLGMWLWLGYGYSGGWLHAKLLVVVVLWAYYGLCGFMLRQYKLKQARYTHTMLRWFNEIPVLLLLLIVMLVVLKPF